MSNDTQSQSAHLKTLSAAGAGLGATLAATLATACCVPILAPLIGRQYQTLLHPDGEEIQLSRPAWDVWLLFDGTAAWSAAGAPTPVWWEHQLRGMPDDVKLDPERFARKAAELARSE